MANFLIGHKALGGIEAGWANNAADKGGETIFGIARNFWPQWDGWIKVDILKRQPDFPKCAETNPDLISSQGRFFKEHFWDPMHLDEVSDQGLANYLYEGVVNFGFGSDDKPRIPHWLQESLNELGAMLPVDGHVGPATLSAIKANANTRIGALFVIRGIMERRIQHRRDVIRKDHSQLANVESWLTRDARLPS